MKGFLPDDTAVIKPLMVTPSHQWYIATSVISGYSHSAKSQTGVIFIIFYKPPHLKILYTAR